MAATYRASAAGGGSSGTGDRSAAYTPALNDLMIVLVSASANTNTNMTCSDNQTGGTYTRIGTALWGSSLNIMGAFVRNALCTTTSAHTVTVATGSNTAAEIVILGFSGMTRTGASAIRSYGSQADQASGTAPAPALNQAALTGNPTIAAVASGDTTTTPNASWTERQDASQSSPTTALEASTRDSGFTGTTITFGATQSTTFASMAIELNGALPDVTGTLSVTDTVGTLSGAGAVAVAGTLSATDPADTLSGVGAVAIAGALGVTGPADALAGVGGVVVAGALSVSSPADSMTAAGAVRDPSVGSSAHRHQAHEMARASSAKAAMAMRRRARAR